MDELLTAVAAFEADQTCPGAKRFVTSLVNIIGVGFHPDTPFLDYVHPSTGARLFDDSHASLLDGKLEMSFALLERGKEDIYAVGLKAQHAILRHQHIVPTGNL